MDATNVLTQLTDTWSKCLDQYYDHVAEEHMKAISEKYNIPISDLMLKSKDLKSNIMKKLTNCMPEHKETPKDEAKKEPKKENKKESKNENNLESLGRKELQELCRQRNIPTKRKNADMVSSIKEYDLKNKPEEINEAEEPEQIVEVEAEEPEQIVEVEAEEELNEDFNKLDFDDSLEEDEYLEEDDIY